MHGKGLYYLSLIAIDHHGLRNTWHINGYETAGIVKVNILDLSKRGEWSNLRQYILF